MDTITKLIYDYYEARKLVKPNIWEALGWAAAEIGEVYEVLFSWNKNWVRNHPEKHPVKTHEDLAEELGDAILMLIAAGLSENVDPMEAMLNKIARTLKELNEKKMTANLSVKMELPTQLELFEEKEDAG